LLGATLLWSRIAAQESVPGRAGAADQQDAGNFSELARRARLAPSHPHKRFKARRLMPKSSYALPVPAGASTRAPSASTALAASVSPSSATAADSSPSSPPASASFLALEDDGSTFNPDTQGAVGPNHLMVTLNSQVRIQDRSGGTISTVPLNSFWASLGKTNVFDPRVLFDPYSQRWIFAAINDSGGPAAGLLLAVSQTSDPTGNWNRYFDTGPGKFVFPDRPSVGFNKDRIIVQVDMYSTNDFSFYGATIFAYNKTNLYAGGAGLRTLFSFQDLPPPNDANNLGGAIIPALTFDSTLTTNYLAKEWNGNADGYGFLRLFSISGPLGSEVFTRGNFVVDSFNGFPWEETAPNDANFAPQLGSTNLIYMGDARLNNVLFRNGSLWTAHTIFGPTNAPTRSAVQWWEITPVAGVIIQHGVIDDPSGNFFYGYPSIGVNTNNDVVVGYSRFSASQYPSANYAFRVDLDLFGSLRADTVLKAGDAPHFVDDSGFNDWGDYSATVVDPANDTDLWTIQEYAASPVNGTDRWGTWWGRISPPADIAVSQTHSPDPVDAGANLTYTLNVANVTTDRITIASGIKLTDTLAPGAVLVSATAAHGSCSLSNGVVTCDLDSLAPGSAVAVTIVVTPTLAGTITNLATVSANGPEINPADNSSSATTVVNPNADVAVLGSNAPNPVTLGSNLTYTVTVTNRGPSPATGVLLTNTLPGSVTLLSATPSQGTCASAGNVVSCNLGSLLNQGQATVTIVVTPSIAGTITDRINVTTSSPDLNSANNATTVVARVNNPPTITPPTAVTINQDTASGPVGFSVSDVETPAANLIVSASSSNPGLVPDSNIVLAGSGGSRTVSLTPLPFQSGSALITLTVTDADGGMASGSFPLTVNAVNHQPTLDPIGSIVIDEDAGVQTVNLTGISSGAPNEPQTLAVTATSSNPSIIPNPAVNYQSPNPAGTLTFASLTNANGMATITVTVNDGGAANNLVSRSFTVNVNPQNDAPTLDPIPNLNISEDSPLQTVSLTGISSGAPNEIQALTVTATSSNPGLILNPSVGYVSPNPTGTLSFTTVPNGTGAATISVTVNDGQPTNNTVTRAFLVTVYAVNHPPTLDPIADVSMSEDGPQRTITLTGITSGSTNEHDTLTVTAASSNPGVIPNPTVTYSSPNTNGTLAFQPVPKANGSVTITVTVNDNQPSNNIVTRTFMVTVTAVNEPPTLDPIANLVIGENAPTQTVNLTGITAGAPNEFQSLLITASVNKPSIIPSVAVAYHSPDANGALTFTPAPNAYGTVTINVTVDDQQSVNNTLTRSFTVTVVPVNHPPTLDAIGNVVIDENSGPHQVTLTGISSGATNEFDSLTVTATSSNPSLVPNPTVNYTSPNPTGILTLAPVFDASGTSTITATVNDNQPSNNIVTRTFIVTVNPVNHAPTTSPISDVDTEENTILVIPFAVSDVDTPLAQVTLSVTSSNQALLANSNLVLGGTAANRTLTMTPAAQQLGTTLISLIASDGLASSTNSFLVTYALSNSLPVMSALADLAISEDTSTGPLPFTVGDPATAAANLVVTGASSNPVLVPNANIVFGGSGSNRTVNITPAPNQFGTARITLTVANALNGKRRATFSLTVYAVNDRPTISPIASQTIAENTSTVALAFTVGDVETPADGLTVAGASSNHALVPDANIVFGGSGANRTVMVIPLSNNVGTATITLMVLDGDGGMASTSFLLTVNGANQAPTLDPIGDLTIAENAGRQIVLLTGITSGAPNENQPLTVTAVSSNPALIPNPTVSYSSPDTYGALTFAPATFANGSATITVTVNDSQSVNNTVSRSFTVTVTLVNTPPSISGIADQTTNEGTPTAAIPITIGDVETAATSLALSATSSNTGLVSTAGIALGGSGPSRTVIITPRPNQFGAAVISLTVTDGAGGSTSTRFVLNVRMVNQLPTLTAIANQTVNENKPTAALPFTIGDLETAATDLVLSGNSSNPALVPNANIVFGGAASNRTVTITPAANQSGTTTITVSVTDTNGGTASTAFSLTLNAVNNPPTISSLPDRTIAEDSSTGPLPFTVGDVETAAASLAVSAVSTNQALVPSANLVLGGSGPNRTVTITPPANQFGTTLITLSVNDGLATTSTSFVLTVVSVNDPPTLNALTNLVIRENAGLQTVNLAGISSGATNESQTLTVTAASGNPGLIPTPTVSYTSPNGTGTLTFKPVTNATGTATITVTVNDGGLSNNVVTRSFTVTVNAVDAPPTISAIASQTTSEDTSITIPFTVADAETPPALLTVTASSTNTTLVPNANILFDGNGTNRIVTIVPATNQFGTNMITLTVSDGSTTAASSFVLTVNPVNDPPTLDPITDVTHNAATMGSTSVNVSLTGISSGAPNESQTLSVSASSSNTALVQTPTVQYTTPGSTATLSFKLANGVTGNATIMVTVNDGQSVNNTFSRSFVVHVKPAANTPPTISAIANQTVNENSSAGPIAFTIGDAETPANLLTVAAAASNPLLLPATNIVLSGSGASRTVTLTPLPNQFGTSTVSISVSDTNFGFTSTNFLLTVNPVNHAPTISTIANQTITENASSGVIPFTVGDLETPAAKLIVTASSSNPALVPNATIALGGSGTNRALQITPAANQNGAATITVAVNDGATGASTSFQLTVTAVNTPPTISTIADQVINENSTSGAITFTVGDVETPAGSLALTANSSNPVLVPIVNIAFGGSASNRTATITPAANQFGATTITLTVNDGAGGMASSVFNLAVLPVNDPPTLDAIGNLMVNASAGPQTVNLTGISSGAADETQTLSVTASSSNPGVIPNPVVTYTSPSATGLLTFTPVAGASGTATIMVTVSDGQTNNSTVTRTFIVAVNGNPTVSPVATQVINENSAAGPIAFTVGDPETPAANLVVNGTSSNPSLIPNANIVFGGNSTNRTATIAPLADQIGEAMITLSVTDGNGNSASNNFLVVVNSVNLPPTLDALADLSIGEDAGPQTVSLSGIGSGASNGNQSLAVTAVSSNPALIPNPIVNYTSPNSSGSLTFAPLADANGAATITVSVNNGGPVNTTVTRSFNVTVTPVNDPPTLSNLPNQTIDQGTTTGVLPFIVADVDTPVVSLTLAGVSSNPTLVPNASIVFGGSGAIRTVTVTPVANQFGSATITITVSDGAAAGSASFLLTVNAVNGLPVITPIADQVVNENGATPPIAFTIGDTETSAANLTLAGNSSNLGLVSNAGIVFGGAGANRTVTITPQSNQFGFATITITVADAAGGRASTSFLLTVNSVNVAPTLDPISNLTTSENAGPQLISLTGITAGAPNENQPLFVTASNNQPALLQNLVVNYASPATVATLGFTTMSDRTGTATITVTVNDGQSVNNTVARTFVVTVNPSILSNAPILRIDLAAGDQVVVSWPAGATGYFLQCRASLSASDGWVAVTNAPVVIGDRYWVTNALSGKSKFYRLVRPPPLSISRANGALVLSWPAEATGFVLESADRMTSSAVWEAVFETPMVVGQQKMVTISGVSGNKFYRLRGH